MTKSKQFRKKYGGSSRKSNRRPVKPKAGQAKTLKQRAEELGARIKSSAVARASNVGTRKKSVSKSHKSHAGEVPEMQRRLISQEQRRARIVAEQREARQEEIDARRVAQERRDLDIFEPEPR